MYVFGTGCEDPNTQPVKQRTLAALDSYYQVRLIILAEGIQIYLIHTAVTFRVSKQSL